MSADGTSTQVIVVGAGPVGLMLAGELRLAGVAVLVLETLMSPTTESRASTLHARTMEVLDSRGLLAPLGDVPDDARGHFGGVPLDLTLPSPYPGQWKVPQTRVEELLGRWATDLGADIRRGHEVTGLTVADEYASVDVRTADGSAVRFRADYVVGCDGENSTVRRLGGFDSPGADAERELLRADVAGIEIPDRRFERLPGGLAIAARRPDGVTRVMVHEFGAHPSGRQPEFSDIVAAWRRVTGEDIGGGTPQWVNAFGDTSRQAARYRDRRLLLAGDAAHQQMPIGGQALNLGLQDAFNLGWKLAAQVLGRGPDGLLDSYHSERHAVGREVLSNIRAQAMLLLGGPEVDGVRQIFTELTGSGRVRQHLAGMISGLDIRHDAGTGTHPLLGRRLPHWRLTSSDGAATSTELLRPGRGVLLVLTADAALKDGLRAVGARWTGLVRTVTATSLSGEPSPDTGALLVRPDGHVVWAGTEMAGLTAALHGWFGAPTEPSPHTPANSAASATPTERSPHTPANSTASATPKNWRSLMGKLTGKTALVTGSSRGIGRATAIRLAQEGALVAVHYTAGKDEAEDVVETIEKDGGHAFTVRAELGVDGDVHELFLGLENALRDRTGSVALDILVNNAGVMGGVKPEETTPETFDRLFAVNARAPFFLIQRALKHMPDGGRIVNITSGLTRCANPDEIAYAMTKGAVDQLALHFAKHLGPRNITVNSVAPGITRNSNPVFDMPEAVEFMAGLSAFNRVGEPEDIADVVAFLATDEARWVTGSFVDATGGTLLG
ncbi:monooxygenase [Streptomyces abyssalis]|uniref:Monooxygenase n=1 Tax=Streptomyces abyssalis TaxID=933944 RepID=A0A1E7JGP9_9ACTN|nr:SDR family oxidoreductase [Streptomyces abyssalis]OEU85639.1 monooxygenase [Streptomyces abyssalis]OEU92897.1 monooxygenase [Streptomyces abyssalis]